MTDFLVRRDDLRVHRIGEGEKPLERARDGMVQFAVERFGLTANNLTYGVFGDSFGYWGLFAAPEGWGRIPVWGFGVARASGVDGVAPGDRFYGYWPMSSLVTLTGRADEGGFVETSTARAPLPPFYNRYFRALPEAGFAPEHDDAAAIMRVLYLTGWLIADQLAETGWHGAEAVVLASASSKTAYATAAAIRERANAPAIVGLTSTRNRSFTEGLGLYDEVLIYDSIPELPRGRRLVLVDMAGDAGFRRRVHEAAGDLLRASIMVGATHWEGASLASDGIPGPEPVLFFAPTVAEQRAAEIGPAALARRLGTAWASFATRLSELIEIQRATGAEALTAAYLDLVEGRADPGKGLIFSL
jgi:hypothetical protein